MITGSATQEARVDREPQRGHERLADRQRRQPAVALRQLQLEPVDQVPVEDVRDDEADEQRAEADEQPLPQLLEMLDERRLLAVPESARWADAHRIGYRTVSFSRCGVGVVSCVPAGSCVVVSVWLGVLPVTESLNSRIPLPSDRPISGRRFAPKRSRATSSRRMISGAPMFPMTRGYQRFGRVPGPGRNTALGYARSTVATLELKNLHVALEDGTEIVKGVDLTVSSGEVHAIMGPNGSGKSTLAYAIAGHPAYEITDGQILLDGADITEAEADERAQAGLFLAFQYPHAIPGRHRDELPAPGDQRRRARRGTAASRTRCRCRSSARSSSRRWTA